MLNTKTIVILPLGAHEQHGPHLPFETDTIIANGIAARIAKALPLSLDIRFLPVEPIGYSIEHIDVEGTKTFTFAEAINRWVNIGKNLYENGIRKFMLLNAHGGNAPLMSVVVTELRARFDMLAVATSWTRFDVPEQWISSEEKILDIHGGFIETSMMLALRPDLVDMSKARNFSNAQSTFIQDFQYLRAYGPHAFGWKIQDLNPNGVVGNAAYATAEAGERLLTHTIGELTKLLEDIDRFDLNHLTAKG